YRLFYSSPSHAFYSLLHTAFLSSTLCFFFTPPATTSIYTLSLHDALPIFLLDRLTTVAVARDLERGPRQRLDRVEQHLDPLVLLDRKSTRLNSSHQIISYAVFCLKKKKKKNKTKYKH